MLCSSGEVRSILNKHLGQQRLINIQSRTGLIHGLVAVCVQISQNLYLPSVLGIALQGLQTEGWIFMRAFLQNRSSAPILEPFLFGGLGD